MNESNARTLDVRPLLANGREPFEAIMEAKAQLVPGQGFHLIAPFPPKPLCTIFEAEGYTVREEKVSEEEWHLFFEPSALTTELSGSVLDLDLRDLEPPLPLQKALEAAARLGRGHSLVIHTRFHPIHLFELLDPEAFDYDCEESATNHWTTHLWRIANEHPLPPVS